MKSRLGNSKFTKPTVTGGKNCFWAAEADECGSGSRGISIKNNIALAPYDSTKQASNQPARPTNQRNKPDHRGIGSGSGDGRPPN